MKKMLAIVMLCFLAVTAMGQATSLRVVNTTGCNVYFRVWVRPSPCPFAGALSSSLITFAPGMTTYTNSSVLGLPANMYFIAAYTYNQPPGCTTFPLTTWMVGDPCTTYAPMVPMYSTTSCALCRQLSARWIPATTAGGQAQLVFSL